MNRTPLLLSALSASLFTVALVGQDRAFAFRAAAQLASLANVHVDRPGDGNVWVLAPGYKARFGSDGVELVPYFGAKAKRSFPVRFRVSSIRRGQTELGFARQVAPSEAPERVVYERGAVTEVWDLRAREVEQSFVIADKAGEGDLVVKLEIDSELAVSDASGGIVFAHPTLGRVEYGDVLAYDGAGRRVTTRSRLVEGAIELVVPARFVAASQGALTIDPVVRAIAVDTGTDKVNAPSVAFEPTTGNWLVAYVREFSVNDTDIISRRFDRLGNLLEEAVVATGSRESRNPSVAANGPARQFLVAWDEDTGIADRVILGRTRDAAGTSQGSIVTILDTSGLGNDDRRPEVGGSIATDASAASYAVVCETSNGSTSRVSFVRVSTAGTPSLVGTLSASGENATSPKLTKSRRTNGVWVCTYLVDAGGAQHVFAATAAASGTAVRRTAVDTSASCGVGGIGGDGVDLLAVYSRVVGSGNSDIFGAHLHFGGTSLSVLARTNLTASEPGASAVADQVRPAVGFDGARFTYCYAEAAGAASAHDLFAAVVSIASPSPPLFSDGHRALHAASADAEGIPTIACTGDMGGGVARSFVVYDRQSPTGDLDVLGTLFDGIRTSGGITTLNTRCGSLALTALDAPILGGPLRLRATALAPASQLFLLGLASAPLKLCTAGCVLGVSTILVTVPGASLDLSIPTSASFLGGTLAAQNVMVGGTGGCTPPAFPVALIVSETLVITIQ